VAFAFVLRPRCVELDRPHQTERKWSEVERSLFVDRAALLTGLFPPARLLSAAATVFGTLSHFVCPAPPSPQQSERAGVKTLGVVLLSRYVASMHPRRVHRIASAVVRRRCVVAHDLGLPARNQEFAPGVASPDADRRPLTWPAADRSPFF